jgi:zinc transport system substrate-binding protein
MSLLRLHSMIGVALAIAAAVAMLVASGCGPRSTDSSGSVPQTQHTSTKSVPATNPADAAESTQSTENRLPVFAGIPPLAYLVEQIGGERVNVGILVQPNQDPHTFDPTPQQIVALSKAKVFFQVGMPFENTLLNKIKKSNTRLVVVDVTSGILKRRMDSACTHDLPNLSPSADYHPSEDVSQKHLTHSEPDAEPGRPNDGQPDDSHPNHGHAESHTETAHAETNHAEADHAGDPDPHVWLSLPLLKQMANNVGAALERIDAASAAFYAENLHGLLDRIDLVHEDICRKLQPYRGQAFYVFHPGFGYFADAYGLRQIAVEAGGRSPSPKQMQALIRQAREERVRVIFVQPQSPQQSARVIAEAVGAKVVTINGLTKDVLADTEDIAAKIELALSSQLVR